MGSLFTRVCGREESWTWVSQRPGDCGHQAPRIPTLPTGLCCSFLSWCKNSSSSNPMLGMLACSSSPSSSSWDAAGCHGNAASQPYTQEERVLLSILTTASCSHPRGYLECCGGNSHPHAQIVMDLPHCSPATSPQMPACSPLPLVLAAPVFSPCLQTPINPGSQFPAATSGMNCALLCSACGAGCSLSLLFW